MEGLNGSNDDRYFNESQFDEAKNVSRSTYFDHNVNWIALSFYTLGLLGNFITALVISCRKDMHTPTFLAICSLAITDFIVIAISVVIELAINFDFFRTNIEFWTNLILYAAMIKSSADVVFLFFMRFALIAYPLKCRVYLTNSLVISLSLVLWAYSLMFISFKYFIEYLIFDLRVSDPNVSDWVSTATLMLIMTVLPIAAMFVLHCVKIKKTSVHYCQHIDNEKNVGCHHMYCSFKFLLWHLVFLHDYIQHFCRNCTFLKSFYLFFISRSLSKMSVLMLKGLSLNGFRLY